MSSSGLDGMKVSQRHVISVSREELRRGEAIDELERLFHTFLIGFLNSAGPAAGPLKITTTLELDK